MAGNTGNRTSDLLVVSPTPYPLLYQAHMLCCIAVKGVTRLRDVVYIITAGSKAILRFNATSHQRLSDIHMRDMRVPCDIVACEQTSQLYVATWSATCVWRASADGADIRRWLTKSFDSNTLNPTSLSVTSTRLLVTTYSPNELIQLDSEGDLLRRVQLPDDMELWHAVESPTATFIVSLEKVQLMQRQISEVNAEGVFLRQFTGSRLSPLGLSRHIAIDSHGNVIVADCGNRCILLLDAQLTLRCVIMDKHQLNDKSPARMCYSEPTGQLLVGFQEKSVVMFEVLRR